MTDKYAVIGNPIAHSKSPLIHTLFAQQTGEDICYEAILAPLDGFASTVERLRNSGYKGCSVTVPFKFDACKIANSISENVIDAIDSEYRSYAVNTLDFKGKEILGYNTDGTGLIKDITHNLNFNIAGKRILLMGAGGAAYGVLHPLLGQKPKELTIANRTLEKAKLIEKQISESAHFPFTSVSSSSYTDLTGKQFDLVINATSSSLSNEMPPLPHGIFADGALAYDMMYGRETPFMQFAQKQGAAIVSDGLGMLVEQAAQAFFIWRGVHPETAPVIASLRNQQ